MKKQKLNKWRRETVEIQTINAFLASIRGWKLRHRVGLAVKIILGKVYWHR